jgi:uncharacterized protein YegL
MRTDLADITLVIDRSGSMQGIRSDAEGGVNAFIEKQTREPGEALLTLVQFDTEYEFVHRGIPVQQVPRYELSPRGQTALLDAIGRAINETGQRLAAMNEQDRPGVVIFVVMTDGRENASHEFTKSEVKQMIELQQAKYNWHFTFLGADQDAFAEAGGLGIDAAGVANFSPGMVFAAHMGTAEKVGRMRRQSIARDKVDNKFTDEERQAMQ